MVNTYSFMLGGFEEKWDTVCCKNTRGSCDGCTGRVLAYVMGTGAADGYKTSQTWIRMCQSGMEGTDRQIGLTIYHELQHMTSAVYDHPTKAYSKKGMVELAVEDPVQARLNSDSYTMYIADSSLKR